MLKKQECMTIIESYKPTTIFLQVGGNDLSYKNNPDKLAWDIISFADYVITCYDVHHVIIGQLLPKNRKLIIITRLLMSTNI